MKIANRESKIENERWLPDMDLNHDKQIQSLLCYRYTIGQAGVSVKLDTWRKESRFVTALQRYSVTTSDAPLATVVTFQRCNAATD